jgi:Trk K+ transport system NAD-binding subunit
MFIGLAFYASLTGVISEALITRSRREKQQRMEENIFTQHIIVCGWNQHAQMIAQQVIQDDHQLILVLASEDLDVYKMKQVFFKNLDPTQKSSLQEGRIMQAAALVLLSDGRLENPVDRDARNMLIALNAQSLRPDIPIIFQLEKEENTHHVHRLGIEKILHLSKIAGIELRNMLTTSEHKTVSVPYKEIPCLTSLVGKSFLDVQLYYAKQEQIVVGICKNNEMQVPCTKEHILHENDNLLILP